MEYTVLRKLSEATKIPVIVFKDDKITFQHPESSRFQSYFETQPIALTMLRGTLTELGSEPILFIEDAAYYFGAFMEFGHVFILGPIAVEKPSGDALAAFRKKHQLTAEAYIPKSSPYRLSSALSLAVYAFSGIDLDPDGIRIVNAMPDMSQWSTDAVMEHYELEESETERDHDSADYEARLMEIVAAGDTEAMEKALYSSEKLGSEHIGVVATDELKQTEYLCVTLLAMLPRAAVNGGMNREHAFSLSDIYLQKLSKCRTGAEMLKLTARAQYDFTLEVKKSRARQRLETRYSYIEDCKAYIRSNLRKPFQISDIAPAIGINRSYLARKFSETEGLTIQQYVTKERCEHAANLLRHSDYPISLIAEYFCFSSQSHFGRAFKDWSGMTPKEYRNKYKH